MIYQFGDSEIDESKRTLRRAGRDLRVQPKVLDLLIFARAAECNFVHLLGHSRVDYGQQAVVGQRRRTSCARLHATRGALCDPKQQLMTASLCSAQWHTLIKVRAQSGKTWPCMCVEHTECCDSSVCVATSDTVKILHVSDSIFAAFYLKFPAHRRCAEK